MINKSFPNYETSFIKDKTLTGSLEVTVGGVLVHSKLNGDGDIRPGNPKVNEIIEKMKAL